MEPSSEDRPGQPGPRPTPGDVRSLRARGHALKPAVTVGRAGITSQVVAEVRQALARDGLIKVRIDAETRTEADEVGAQLADQVGGHLIQRVGRVILLYREPDAQEQRHE